MNTVTVKINGVEYNLKGKENEKYLLAVAEYVDGKFKEISANNNKLSTTAVAVLSALNIADEYFKCELDNEELVKRKNSLEEKCMALKERLKEVKVDSEEYNKTKNNEIDNLKSIICSMEEKIKEVDNLYSTIDNLHKELEETKQKLQAEKEEFEKNFVTKTEELKQNFAYEKDSLTESYDRKVEELKNALEGKKQELTLLNLKNEELKKAEVSLKDEVILKEKEIEECKYNSDEIKKLKSRINSIENEKEVLKKSNKELKFKLQNSRYKLLDLEKKLNDANFNLAIEKKIKNPLLK